MNEQLVEAYMGSKYNDVVNPSNKYKVKAAIIGYICGPALLFFYRSYLIGTAALICHVILNFITSNVLSLAGTTLNMLFGVAYGYFTYPIYNWDARRKINHLIKKHPDLSEEELISLAAHKGHNSIIALILYILAFIAYVTIILMYIIHAVEQSV